MNRSDNKEELKEILERILSLLGIVILVIGFGTFVYSRLEGWSFVDSLYFSTTTLTTIGFGDLHPTTETAKLFTVFYALTGVSIMLYVLSVLGPHYVRYLDAHKPIITKNVKNALKSVYPNGQKKDDHWVMLNDKKKF
jgi:hypothetical protein